MERQLRVLPDAAALARAGAEVAADRISGAAARAPSVALALSGGRTPWAMFQALAAYDLPWDRVVIFQVDERVAPAGDPDRNAGPLAACFENTAARVVPMPVEVADLAGAALDYAASLPGRFDLVHLGLGADGHTASLVPDDPVLDDVDDFVAVTGTYQGHRRMTLTYRALARATEILWLVSGADKRAALSALVRGDPSIPAGRVEAPRSLILADADAAGAEPVQRVVEGERP